LGLGLAISRQLVELHGGTILAESDGIGFGARFVVKLPAYQDIGQSADAPAPRRLSSDATLNAGVVSLFGLDVLVVDDEDDTLSLFREALEAAGANVRVATSGVDAIRENADRPADLLVTDLALPGMDGFELLAAVRKTSPHIAAVAVTAFARLDDRSRSLAAGFQAHVSKPIDPQAFVRTLAGALALSKKG
jgi:CheY-like chemotaxis protein